MTSKASAMDSLRAEATQDLSGPTSSTSAAISGIEDLQSLLFTMKWALQKDSARGLGDRFQQDLQSKLHSVKQDLQHLNKELLASMAVTASTLPTLLGQEGGVASKALCPPAAPRAATRQPKLGGCLRAPHRPPPQATTRFETPEQPANQMPSQALLKAARALQGWRRRSLSAFHRRRAARAIQCWYRHRLFLRRFAIAAEQNRLRAQLEQERLERRRAKKLFDQATAAWAVGWSSDEEDEDENENEEENRSQRDASEYEENEEEEESIFGGEEEPALSEAAADSCDGFGEGDGLQATAAWAMGWSSDEEENEGDRSNLAAGGVAAALMEAADDDRSLRDGSSEASDGSDGEELEGSSGVERTTLPAPSREISEDDEASEQKPNPGVAAATGAADGSGEGPCFDVCCEQSDTDQEILEAERPHLPELEESQLQLQDQASAAWAAGCPSDNEDEENLGDNSEQEADDNDAAEKNEEEEEDDVAEDSFRGGVLAAPKDTDDANDDERWSDVGDSGGEGLAGSSDSDPTASPVPSSDIGPDQDTLETTIPYIASGSCSDGNKKSSDQDSSAVAVNVMDPPTATASNRSAAMGELNEGPPAASASRNNASRRQAYTTSMSMRTALKAIGNAAAFFQCGCLGAM